MERMYQLPGTELTVSRIGLGTVKAGLSYRGEGTERLLGAFLEQGGNLIDTARVYSDWIPGERGRSENEIGRAVRRLGIRNRIVLMTKGGHPDMTVPAPDMHRSRNSEAEIRADVEASLRALQTDVIDIYFYHRDQESLSVAEETETMEALVREGKIRYYACSNWSAQRIEEADAYCAARGYRGFVADEALLNLGVKHMKPPKDDTLRALQGELRAYHERNRRNTAMPYSSVAEGYFHHILKNPATAAGSVYDTEGNRQAAFRVRELMEQRRASLTQVLLGFFLHQPFPCIPLVGPAGAEQLSDLMKTMEIPFRDEDYRDFMP